MTKERYKSIDILKGIAIIMVILVHYNQQFSNGVKLFEYFQMGCPIFFVISGFSIALLISRKFEDIENRDTRKRFYLSRLKAIAPAWYLTFIVIYLINLITYLLKNNVIDLVVFKDPLAVIGNLFFLNGIIPSANYSFMPGGWFIGTLVILYLLTPFVIDLMNKKNTRMIFIITSSISIMLLVVIKLLFNQTFIHNGFGYFLFLNHYPSYCLGIMLFYELKNKLLNEKERKVNTIISIIAYLIAILVF